jgi:quercetin dioxygenase-like cupin family protein
MTTAERKFTPPANHRILLENERVRVMEVAIRPGETSGMHEHPASVVYQLTDCRVRFAFPDGSNQVVDSKAGNTVWTNGVQHEVHNIGTTDDIGIIVELKQ